MSSTHPDTRSRILDATRKLLEANPAKAVRMSDIAKETGISRQALYLHYPTRAELLVATARHLEDVNDADARLAASRAARSGVERLDAFVEAWGNYIPVIYGVAKAFIAMQDTDEAAAAAWRDRMAAVREGCAAAVEALASDGTLAPGHTMEEATDLLWTLLSVRNWEQLTIDCGWSQARYVAAMQRLAADALVRDHGAKPR